jgi:uncharacterized membrane protein YraQ (UPF0718 family)
MLAGVSPGAVLVFLLAGPATNIATLGVIRQEMGGKTLISYLIGVIGVAIGFGYLTNILIELWQINISAEFSHSHTVLPLWLVITTAIILAMLVAKDIGMRVYLTIRTYTHQHEVQNP